MSEYHYDEFGLFHENATENGLPFPGAPVVERLYHVLGDGRTVSALKFGHAEPEFVFLHGASMNAHTWDTVAMALQRPCLALDLPGHGHSSWRNDMQYSPVDLAADVAPVIAEHAPNSGAIVGMSLGGMASLVLATGWPELTRRLVMVDITPGTNREKAKAVLDFIDGPQEFASFEALLERTMEHNPTRSESSLRRGILHNARPQADGSWMWRWHRAGRSHTDEVSGEAGSVRADNGVMWNAVSAIACPVLLVRGGVSPVVDDDDVAEFTRRQPNASVAVVDGAGHSVQGDCPLELAVVLNDFVPRQV